MKPTTLGRNDPRRNEVLSLVRRQVRAGTFKKSDVAAWKKALEADVVDAIIQEFAPKKAGGAVAEPEKE